MDIYFHYRITAEAQMARDTETQEPTECFSRIKIGGAQKPLEDYDARHKEFAVSIARQFKLQPEWVIPISKEEYDRDHGEDDDGPQDQEGDCE